MPSGNKGALTLEAILGIVLLSVVATTAGITILRTSQYIANMRQNKTAAALGEAIMEFYQNESLKNTTTNNFYNLGQFNHATPVPVQTFLNLSYNPGNFYVMTYAQMVSNQGSVNCLVTSTVTWRNGSKTNTMFFARNFTERTFNSPSGSAVVYVGLPCPPYTTPPYATLTQQNINAGCSGKGFSGFVVSAPSQVNPNVSIQAVTGADGVATLVGIQLSTSNITFTAQASKPSYSMIKKSDPGFVQGYYHIDSDPPDAIITEDTQSSSVAVTGARIAFTDFLKAGHIKGHVSEEGNPSNPLRNAAVQINDYPYVVAPPVLNMAAGPGAGSGGYQECSPKTSPCAAYTDYYGDYELNNILPIPTNFNLIVEVVGSSYTCPTGTTSDFFGNTVTNTDPCQAINPENDAGFVQGYAKVNAVSTVDGWLALPVNTAFTWDATSLASTPTLTVGSANLTAYAKKSLKIQITPPPAHSLPDSKLKAVLTMWSGVFERPPACTFMNGTDVNGDPYGPQTGTIYLNNIIVTRWNTGSVPPSAVVFSDYVRGDVWPAGSEAPRLTAWIETDPANIKGWYGHTNLNVMSAFAAHPTVPHLLNATLPITLYEGMRIQGKMQDQTGLSLPANFFEDVNINLQLVVNSTSTNGYVTPIGGLGQFDIYGWDQRRYLPTVEQENCWTAPPHPSGYTGCILQFRLYDKRPLDGSARALPYDYTLTVNARESVKNYPAAELPFVLQTTNGMTSFQTGSGGTTNIEISSVKGVPGKHSLPIYYNDYEPICFDNPNNPTVASIGTAGEPCSYSPTSPVKIKRFHGLLAPYCQDINMVGGNCALVEDYYDCTADWNIKYGQLFKASLDNPVNITCPLKNYRAYGYVRYPSGIGIPNIPIYDEAKSLVSPVAVTGADGSYSGKFSVLTYLSGPDAGKFYVVVKSGNWIGSTEYEGVGANTKVVTLPTTVLTPKTGISVSFTKKLVKQGSGM